MIQAKKVVIDLKLKVYYSHSLFHKIQKGMAHEYRKNNFLTSNRFFTHHDFRKCVQRYEGNHKVKSFSCFDQFLCMAFAQLTYRESLRDIEACLRSMREKLYHMGIRGKASRSTLADANENRNWCTYADFAQVLIHRARALYRSVHFV
ncbi:MAG: ISPg4, transposase [Candidatus Jettenia ecosi]|uniref:ISPg4, transposase n=1 Tax=Candidatus Jettenia ecosi TaxID=2494326 RepID=A0A533Q700_9BACT|nr:MAG: ISPg4, transposase [Candidatus Jettenia ecosi]